jgi:hypothetical protein
MGTGAQVTVEVEGRGRWVLGHGAIIGRLWTADLHLPDPRVSEAHALVSLRDGAVVLLSLRRRVLVAGVPHSEVPLAPGLEVELAPGLALRVVDVRAPAEVLAVRLAGGPPQALLGGCSVVPGAPWRLVPGQPADAALHLWSDGQGWWAAGPALAAAPVGPGAVLALPDGRDAQFASIRLGGAAPTGAAPAGLPAEAPGAAAGPLRLVVHYDSVELGLLGSPPTRFGGRPARVLAELVALGGPVGWEVVAREVWREESNIHALRRSWDSALHRLRARLRACGVREDLITSAGPGLFTLNVLPGDTVEDRS